MTHQLAEKAQNLKEMFSKFRNRRPQVHFEYKNIPSSENLDYEMISYQNYKQLYYMFKKDDSPFIINDFRDEAELDAYIVNLLEAMHYSPKYGGIDYFFKTKEGVYAGVLHLYDLNLETHREHKCTIGFATKAAFRKNGLTTEAVRRLFAHIKNHYKRKEVLAYTSKKNLTAQRFLEKLGFELSFDYPLDKKHKYYEVAL